MKTLAEIYARIPAMECKGKCQECCGPITIQPVEAEVIRGRVGARLRTVPLDGSSALMVLTGKTLTCPLLNPDGKCSVYADRPAICRIWGVVKEMRCPFGCKPKRWMTKAESFEILSEVETL